MKVRWRRLSVVARRGRDIQFGDMIGKDAQYFNDDDSTGGGRRHGQDTPALKPGFERRSFHGRVAGLRSISSRICWASHGETVNPRARRKAGSMHRENGRAPKRSTILASPRGSPGTPTESPLWGDIAWLLFHRRFARFIGAVSRKSRAIGLAGFSQIDQRETSATQPRGKGIDHAKRQRGCAGCVDGISTGLEHFHACVRGGLRIRSDSAWLACKNAPEAFAIVPQSPRRAQAPHRAEPEPCAKFDLGLRSWHTRVESVFEGKSLRA
jgi:hypothetical protein